MSSFVDIAHAMEQDDVTRVLYSGNVHKEKNASQKKGPHEDDKTGSRSNSHSSSSPREGKSPSSSRHNKSAEPSKQQPKAPDDASKSSRTNSSDGQIESKEKLKSDGRKRGDSVNKTSNRAAHSSPLSRRKNSKNSSKSQKPLLNEQVKTDELLNFIVSPGRLETQSKESFNGDSTDLLLSSSSVSGFEKIGSTKQKQDLSQQQLDPFAGLSRETTAILESLSQNLTSLEASQKFEREESSQSNTNSTKDSVSFLLGKAESVLQGHQVSSGNQMPHEQKVIEKIKESSSLIQEQKQEEKPSEEERPKSIKHFGNQSLNQIQHEVIHNKEKIWGHSADLRKENNNSSIINPYVYFRFFLNDYEIKDDYDVAILVDNNTVVYNQFLREGAYANVTKYESSKMSLKAYKEKYIEYKKKVELNDKEGRDDRYVVCDPISAMPWVGGANSKFSYQYNNEIPIDRNSPLLKNLERKTEHLNLQ